MSKWIGATSALFVVVRTPRRKICTDNHECHVVGEVTSPKELVLALLSILGDKLNSGNKLHVTYSEMQARPKCCRLRVCVNGRSTIISLQRKRDKAAKIELWG
uniref:Uncharacterized protein n=1 Tax=Peronospora matthiolae TaxID=2874970 RepID=A0AAV1UGT9_9STRA